MSLEMALDGMGCNLVSLCYTLVLQGHTLVSQAHRGTPVTPPRSARWPCNQRSCPLCTPQSALSHRAAGHGRRLLWQNQVCSQSVRTGYRYRHLPLGTRTGIGPDIETGPGQSRSQVEETTQEPSYPVLCPKVQQQLPM